MDTGLSLPRHRLPALISRAPAEQLVLIGQPQPIRVPEHRWRSWLDDPEVVARFEAKRYRRAADLYWVWIGGVSSTGRGSFRAASLPGPTRRGTVPAHLFAYQLAHGVIPRLGVVQHRERRNYSSMRLRRVHQPHTHAVGRQRHQPHRIPHSAKEPRQPTRRRARRSRARTRYRSRRPRRSR
jgi:hypothetical protein